MRILPVLPLLLLAACSGGGGGGGVTPAPTPAPANRAPAFTSAAAVNVVENGTYQATATDADGNPVTFSIAGGADAARFSITAAGALSFTTAPNFEAPADTGANNVYNVQLRVSDGSLSATLDLAVTVTNSREGIAVRRVGTGFNQPVYVAPVRGQADVYVVEKGGGIYRFRPSSGEKFLLFTVPNLSTDGERGALGMTLLPGNTGFILYCTAVGGDIELRRYDFAAPGSPPILRATLSIPHPGANNHNGGWMDIGPDGLLYAATGDGGGAGDPGNNAQNPNSRLGKILRVQLGNGPTWLSPAPGNPFIGGGGDPYVFATGLRNPFRASFGPDGRLYIGDVGQGAIEEIDVVRPDQPGLNFGWRFFEGTNAFTGTPPAGVTFTPPVSQYAHGTGEKQGRTIIGGYVYRGPVTSLVGSYVFADFVNGHIWTLPANQLVQGSLFPADSYERRNVDFTPDAGTIDQIVSFGEDDAGNLFIVDILGEIFMVVPG